MMKRLSILGSRKAKQNEVSPAAGSATDTPEFNAPRAVRKFCEAGAPGNQGGSDEAVHLPVIVESCESSPKAAGAAAYQIRKYLSKENYKKPHLQYNSIMLIRILADNPGQTFTKNIDSKFVAAVKELLKNSHDPSVQHLLRETLATLNNDKKSDQNLEALFRMWDKEKNVPPPMPLGQAAPPTAGRPAGMAPPVPSRSKRLPPPAELAGRIHEARTSAQLLNQIVLSTPATEFAGNDLIKEFADRCSNAQRNMQQYMNATDPAPPDEQTFKTLIETSEQLGVAMSRHQRAVLASRQASGQLGQPVGQEAVPPTSTHPAYAQQQQQQQPSQYPQYPTQQPPQQQYANSFAPTGAPAIAPVAAASSQQPNPFSDDARVRAPQSEKQSAQHTATEVTDDDIVPPPGPPPGRRAAPTPPPPRLTNPNSTPPRQTQPRSSDDDLYGTSPAVQRNAAPQTQYGGTAATTIDPTTRDFATQSQPFADHSGRNWGDASPLEGDFRGLTMAGDELFPPNARTVAAENAGQSVGQNLGAQELESGVRDVGAPGTAPAVQNGTTNTIVRQEGMVVKDDDPITPTPTQEMRSWRT